MQVLGVQAGVLTRVHHDEFCPLQVLCDILSAVLEDNQRRDSKSGPASSRLQCLRCRSEFSSHLAAGEEEDSGSRVGVMLRDGEEGRNREEQTEADYNSGSSGEGCRDRLWNVKSHHMI